MWPEEGIFGTMDIEQDEELNMLESIYNADLGVDSVVTGKNWQNMVQNS